MTFGGNLKQIRSERGISQGQLAGMIDMHSTHISRYERNMANPTIEVVKKIAEALEVSVDYLVYGNQEQKVQQNIQDNELLRMFSKAQKLGAEDIKVIKSLLGAYLLKTDLQNKLAS